MRKGVVEKELKTFLPGGALTNLPSFNICEIERLLGYTAVSSTGTSGITVETVGKELGL
jgi:hypothetical protein